MITSLVRKIFRASSFFRDRRAVTAMTLAILAVPILITADAAIDMARIVTARTLLQSAVDSSALAGASAWNMSENPAYANTVTTATFKGAAANLSVFGTYSTPTPGLACNGENAGSSTTTSPTPCDIDNTHSSSYSTSLTNASYTCPNAASGTAMYCVAVTASVSTKNMIIGQFVPQTTLTVTGYGEHPLSNAVSGTDIPPSPGFGSAGDVSGINAYAVPMLGNTPQFGSVPTPNGNCANYANFGPLALLENSTTTSGSCNYLFIALSTSSGTSGAGGSLTLATNQPIAFTFTNYTGANGYHSSTYATSTTNLEIKAGNGSTTYYANGETINTYTTTTTTVTCEHSGNPTTNTGYYNSNGTCKSANQVTNASSSTSTTGTTGSSSSCTTSFTSGSTTYCEVNTTVAVTLASTTLSGSCPDHTLYGSLDPLSVNTTTGANNDGIPVADSLNLYSSAYEILGEPPTYQTNHALIPFVSPLQTSTTVNGTTYKVNAICPNYSISGTSISAPIDSTYAATIAQSYLGSSTPSWTGVNIYSTAFAGQTYTDTDNALNPPEDTSGNYTTNKTIAMTTPASNTDIYSPTIAGCSAAYHDEDGAITPTSSDPWWNWLGSNSGSCGTESSTYKADSTTAYNTPAETLANGASAHQPSYSNCTLLIQDNGTASGNTPNIPTGTYTISGNSVTYPLLPDYYLIVSSVSSPTTADQILALEPIYDHHNWHDLLPGVIVNKLGSINDTSITVNTSTDVVTDSHTAATYNSDGTVTNSSGYTGYTPSSTQYYQLTTANYTAPTSGTSYLGDYVISETPATYSSIHEFNLPALTSGTCYNPRKNGNTSGTNGITIQAGSGVTSPTFTAPGTYNLPTSSAGIDKVANPQLGAIMCNSSTPESYALYWNDLGTYESDDLGYWNAITAFTCSSPGSSRTGGLATLSG